MTMRLTEPDLADLRRAHDLLENPGLTAKAVQLLGKPIEMGFARLPRGVNDKIQAITRTSIEKALDVAIRSLGKRGAQGPSSDRKHKALTGAFGAVGGAFGMAGLAAELPLSTTTMLRSIADIARSEGEDLTSLEVRLSCLQVFTLGGPSPKDDAAETGYFAVRAVFAKTVTELAEILVERGAVRRGTPALVSFVGRVASRFGITVSQKVAAQAVPIVGAVGGATINVLFTGHFQDMARGHFIVRRLERVYGPAVVREAYERLA